MNKLLITTALILSIVYGYSQTTSKIIGEIKGEEQTYYLSTGAMFIQLELTNQKFELDVPKGEQPEGITLATYSSKEGIDYLSPTIWIDADEVNITFDLTKGEKNYTIDQKYIYQDISEKIENATIDEQLILIQRNISRYPAIFFLYKNIEKYPFESVELTYSNISEETKSMLIAQRVNSYIKAKKLATPKKGSSIVSLELENREGTMVQFKPNTDKVTLLAFVSTGCYYCMSGLPVLSRLYKEYGEDMEFVTIWDDYSREDWLIEKAEQKSVIEWTDLWDKTNFADPYFEMTMSPTFYLIDQNGLVINILEGFKVSKLEKAIANSQK